MSYRIVRNLMEWSIVLPTLIVGIVTAALDITFGGFTPILWFLISWGADLVIICTEVPQIREFLGKKEK